MRTESVSTVYKERDKLYTMHFCFAFVSRTWDLGIVLLIASITNSSLFVVSLIGFMSAFFVFLMMPQVGKIMDKCNRLLVVQGALVLKAFLVCVVYVWCYQFVSSSLDHIVNWKLYVIPILVALVAVCFATVTQSIEKDWIVVLSCGDSTWLSVTNSSMSQIDLVCATIAPVFTGVLFGQLETKVVVLVLLSTNLLATACLMWFLRSVYISWPALSIQIKPPQSSTADGGSTSSSLVDAFLQSGCAGTLISYSMLYLTCLSYGSLMIVYLRWAGVKAEYIGFARGGAAVIGCIGAAAFPYIKTKLGLSLTAQLSILCQSILVVLATWTFFWSDRRLALVVLMCTLVTVVPAY